MKRCRFGCGQEALHGKHKDRCASHHQKCPNSTQYERARSSITTDKLCKNGCGRVGVRRVPAGVLCAPSPNSCPVVVEKNTVAREAAARKGGAITRARAKVRMATRLVKNSRRTFDLRDLVKHGLKERCCEGCGITEWCSGITKGRAVPAPLDIDHINGDKMDNRLENLRVLCKNCHGLTPTYGWRGARLKQTGVPQVLVG